MAFNVNTITQNGTLTKDAVFTAGNTPRLNFSMAHNDGWGDNKTTEYFDVVLWGKRGENLAQYLTKGTLVVVTGRFSTRKYDYNGQNRVSLQINAADVTMVPRLNGGAAPTANQDDEFADDVNDNDDVPF